MNGHDDLFNLYTQWRRLTEIESEAIGSGHWLIVNQQQTLKEHLKEEILRATEQWHAAWPTPAEARLHFDREVRPVLADLITLEGRNHQRFCERRRRAEADVARLEQSARNLRRVHRAYGGNGVSVWHSYS